ncbi:MAG: hypothetical protein KA157_13265 [Aliarcobacter sp.]|nr:hypothetical protein [Aliarcobacter sp.]
MSKKATINIEEKIASNRYSNIKYRVTYELKEYWEREDFIRWFVNKEKKCCYCLCSAEELNKFYDLNSSKRKSTRGKSLEIERIEDKEYSENNCELSCYWCNNAKSDVFTYEEFKNIGKSIGEVIRNKINK